MKNIVPSIFQVRHSIAKPFTVFLKFWPRYDFRMHDGCFKHVPLRSVRSYCVPNIRRNIVNHVARSRRAIKSHNRKQFTQIGLKLIPCQCEPTERRHIRREFWLRVPIQVLTNYFQTRQRINASKIACANSTALNDVLRELRAVTFSYMPRKSPSITSNSICFIYASLWAS